MAQLTITTADGEICAYGNLAPGAIDTVTFDVDLSSIEVVKAGAEEVFFTVDGSDPTVDGKKTFWLPAGGSNGQEVRVETGGDTVVKVRSAAAMKYRVGRGASAQQQAS